ncbi:MULTISPECIES: PLP-dependent aminotransferase family protein [unclassified Rathayibacter]|uniref:MocR-like pyridoxine biosynthesis transcription factor PdxR n=1 Tax=unclassified Rathayibacter TaxID=2609250 RepID=UPI00188D9124|nr:MULTISPECIES: PLP-dependent aminotransferase family protein [unclassified Rathayibacter]MBF4462727.1 PLP-dependent aminotransferase family protein [Rathayibacter sp. VKM Ac-2879]MBF4504141.1 PLP-dependent aminotransferase family protein [Rathayibacter sp. VKM Ac-2878]
MASGDLEVPLLLAPAPRGSVRAALAEALRQAVLDGRYRAGDPIPASRVLAEQLGVSRGSVVAAVDQLVGEGYLLAHPRAAVTVASDGLLVAPRDARAASQALPGASVRARVDLRPGRPDTRALDTPEWRAAWRRAVAGPPAVVPDAAGDPALREQIAEQLRRSRGVDVDTADVFVTSGTADAVALLARAVAVARGRGVRVAVEDPGYPAVRRRLAADRHEVLGVPVRGDGMDLAQLADPDLVVVTPSHQYPTGGRLALAARLELVRRSAGGELLVVEDDYDSEFRYVGAPLPALASLDTTGGVAHVGSFSKTVSPWLRVAYLALPGTSWLRGALAAVDEARDASASGPTQAALAEFMASGAFRRHLTRSRRRYAHRRGLVQAFAEAIDWGTARGLDGGLHVVLSLPSPLDASAVCAALLEEGLLVATLHDYALSGRADSEALVLGYGNAGDLELGSALTLVDRTVRRLLARGIPGS